jgi:hypothetical protein
MKILVALCLSAACCGAAGAPGEIDALITAARSLPPEFAADSLLRLAAIDQVDRGRKTELIGQAFEKGSQAQQRYKRHSVLNPGQTSLPFLNKAYQQGLDALSLQLRAVDAMLALDPGQARALFLRIPALDLKPLQCSDALAYDVDHYYDTAGKLAAHSFGAREKAAGDGGRFLARYASAMTSPVEAGPMADAIAGQEFSSSDFASLVATYATALGKIREDDRSFTSADKLGARIEALVAQCKRRQVSPLPLIEGYRLYLVVHLSAARCADDDRMSGNGVAFGLVLGQDTGQAQGSMVSFFNEKLRMDPLQPIQEIESTPSRLEGAAAVRPSCQEDGCRAVSGKYRELVVDPNGVPLRPADRNTAGWQSKLEAVLSELRQWSPEKPPHDDYFREKASLYNELLTLAPAGMARDAVLRDEIAFLLGSRQVAASRMEWFVPLNALLARTVLDPLGFGAAAADLRKSSDPVISLYARLEAVAPRPADIAIRLL